MCKLQLGLGSLQNIIQPRTGETDSPPGHYEIDMYIYPYPLILESLQIITVLHKTVFKYNTSYNTCNT
jgi:hypothetical protein